MGLNKPYSFRRGRRTQRRISSSSSVLLFVFALIVSTYFGVQRGGESARLMKFGRSGEPAAGMMASLSSTYQIESNNTDLTGQLGDSQFWQRRPGSDHIETGSPSTYHYIPARVKDFRLKSVSFSIEKLDDDERVDIRAGTPLSGYFITRVYSDRILELFELPSGVRQVLAQHSRKSEARFPGRFTLETLEQGGRFIDGSSSYPVFNGFRFDNNRIEISTNAFPPNIVDISILEKETD